MRSVSERWRKVALCVGAVLLVACHKKPSATSDALAGSGVVKTEERAVTSFSELDVSGIIHATVTQGAAPHLTLRGDDNLLPHVLAKQEGPRLSLLQDQTLKPSLLLSAEVTAPPLALIMVEAAAHLSAKNFHADKLDVRVGGAGQLDAIGSADELVVTGTLAARIDLSGLPARKATVTLEKGAHLKLGYVEELVANVRDVAHLEYAGDPKLEEHVSAFGSVTKIR